MKLNPPLQFGFFHLVFPCVSILLMVVLLRRDFQVIMSLLNLTLFFLQLRLPNLILYLRSSSTDPPVLSYLLNLPFNSLHFTFRSPFASVPTISSASETYKSSASPSRSFSPVLPFNYSSAVAVNFLSILLTPNFACVSEIYPLSLRCIHLFLRIVSKRLLSTYPFPECPQFYNPQNRVLHLRTFKFRLPRLYTIVVSGKFAASQIYANRTLNVSSPELPLLIGWVYAGWMDNTYCLRLLLSNSAFIVNLLLYGSTKAFFMHFRRKLSWK